MTEVKKTTGRKSIPASLLRARRDTTIMLKLNGFSNETVKKRLNTMAEHRGWGEVTLRTVERDISSYYKENQPNNLKDIEDTLSLRGILGAQMETTIEQMTDLISEKNIAKSWVKGEKEKALKILMKMLKDYASFNGWDMGQHNFSKITLITDWLKSRNENSMWDKASEQLDEMSEEDRSEISDVIDQIIAKTKKIEENQETESNEKES